MTRRLSFLISCALAATATMTAQTEAPVYDGAAQLAAARADLANWMKYLPDEVFAAHVSIPGSHDTATGHNVTLAFSSKAQEAKLDEQLAGGVRAFDIRPDMNGDVLNCTHGAAKTDLNVRDAIRMMADYLDEHPSEFMVIHVFRGNVKNDGSADSRAKINAAVNEIFNEGELAKYFVDFRPDLKVKDMRGKIVLFRRDAIAYAHFDKAGNLGGWPSDSELWVPGNAATAMNATDISYYGRVRVTDVSSPKNEDMLNTELQSITNLFNYNCTELRPNAAAIAADGKYQPEWSMIFTSGEYTSGQKGYLTNATHTNPLLTKLINEAEVSGPTGVVFSDWVLRDNFTYSNVDYATKGAELVTAIIENNFKYIGEFIFDDSLLKEEPITETDRFGGKECYFRNVATGKYLSAGADWGTHAVLDNSGIAIRPLFNKRTGEYMLRTTFNQNGVENYLGSNCYIDNTAFNYVRFVEGPAAGTYYIVYDGIITEGEESRNAVLALAPRESGNVYADGLNMLIENVEFSEADDTQLWEVLSREELLEELGATANPEVPVDLSFMVRGAKNRVNDGENESAWTFTVEPGSTCAKMEVKGTNNWNDKTTILRVYTGYHSAANVGKMYWTLEQTLENMPNGVYSISMQALADNLPLDNEAVFSFTINGTDMREGMATNATGKLSCTQALDKFRDESLGYCRLEREGIIVSDGKIHIVAKRGVMETNAYTGFFLDNITLTYHGPQGMEAIEYTPADEYNTLILPFAAEIPAGMELFSTAGYSHRMESYHVLELVAEEAIEANTPYIVRQAAAARAAAEPVKFWGVKEGDATATYTRGLLAGVHADGALPDGAFALGRVDENTMAFTRAAAGASVAAGRAYILDADDEAINAADSKVGMLRFELRPGDVSGVESVSVAEEISADTTVDVYSLAGAMLRRGVRFGEALEGLESGVYIVRSASAVMKVLR